MMVLCERNRSPYHRGRVTRAWRCRSDLAECFPAAHRACTREGRELQREAQEGDRNRNRGAPAVVRAGADGVRFGAGMKTERRDRGGGQPEAAQRIALLLLGLRYGRGTVAQALAWRAAVFALVIVGSRLRFMRLNDMSLTGTRMSRGRESMAQPRVHHARVDDSASQRKQPDQQHMDCESAKTLGPGGHGSDYLAMTSEDMDEDTFGADCPVDVDQLAPAPLPPYPVSRAALRAGGCIEEIITARILKAGLSPDADLEITSRLSAIGFTEPENERPRERSRGAS